MELTSRISSTFILCSAMALYQLISARVIDMTYDFDENAITWPVNPRFKLTIMHRGLYKDTGLWMEKNNIALAEHTGTHIDAPAHFGKGKWKMHKVPLEKLMGPGVIINVKDKVKNNIDYAVTIDDVKKWEKRYGKIPSGAIVLMNSGWQDRFGDFYRAYNTSNLEDLSSFHHPGWHGDTTKWLLDKRDINVLGGDTPSFDIGQSTMFPVHKILLNANKCGVENVGFLDRVPESGSMMYLSAMKIKDGSGAPMRMFAIVDSASRTAPGVLFLVFITILSWV